MLLKNAIRARSTTIVSRMVVRSMTTVLLAMGCVHTAQALGTYEVSPSVLSGKMLHYGGRLPPGISRSALTQAASTAAQTAAATTSGLPGIDSVANFLGSYHYNGFDPAGNPNSHWYYAMVGNDPERGGVTIFDAPIIPVIVELLDANGAILKVNGIPMIADPTKYVSKVLASPVFSKQHYSSSGPATQFTDAVMRAAFMDELEDNWHTLLQPSVKHAKVMRLPYGSYYYGLNTDGTLAFVLASDPVFSGMLFPPTYPVDNSTILGSAELSGEFTTKTIGTLLFDNVYLYENNDPTQCCVLGYHSIDVEPGTTANGGLLRLYVMDYSSWISPGLFGGGFEDILALSHEVAEIYNDPFVGFDNVHNVSPWWLSPGGLCSDILEVGDVIEGNPAPAYPMTINGFTYHPQNEALLEWFEFKSPSRALGGAYSYPDPTQLTALSPPEKLNCQ